MEFGVFSVKRRVKYYQNSALSNGNIARMFYLSEVCFKHACLVLCRHVSVSHFVNHSWGHLNILRNHTSLQIPEISTVRISDGCKKGIDSKDEMTILAINCVLCQFPSLFCVNGHFRGAFKKS